MTITVGRFNAEETAPDAPLQKISLGRFVAALGLTLLGPGMGHLFLKFKKRGWFFLVAASVYLLVSLGHLMSLMMAAIEEQKKILATSDPSQVTTAISFFYVGFMKDNAGLISFYEWLGIGIFVGCLADLFYLYVKRADGRFSTAP